jgi:hypothetical protein
MPLSEKPALAAGVERRDFGSYGVVAPPGSGSMLHLEPDEYRLLGLIDGTRTEGQLEAAGGAPVAELLRDLWDEGYLVGSPQPRARRVTVTLHGIEFSGFDRVAQAVKRRIGDFVFSVRGALIFAVVAFGP